jgi:hypothetical protein
MRSFTDPDTEFELERSDTPVDVDGFKLGEPTGRVSCASCGATAHNIDEIPHEPGCPQRFVHSHWYIDSAVSDGT